MPFRRRLLRSRRRPLAGSPAHATPAPVQCPLCALTYLDWTRLAAHARSHLHDLYICRRADCNQGFRRMTDLRAHVRANHRRFHLPTISFPLVVNGASQPPRGVRMHGQPPAAMADTVDLLEALASVRLHDVAVFPDGGRAGGLRVEFRPAILIAETVVPPVRNARGLRTLSFPFVRLPKRPMRNTAPRREVGGDAGGVDDLRRVRSEVWGTVDDAMEGGYEVQGETGARVRVQHGAEERRGWGRDYDWGHGQTVEEEWAAHDGELTRLSPSPTASSASDEERVVFNGLQRIVREMMLTVENSMEGSRRGHSCEAEGGEKVSNGW